MFTSDLVTTSRLIANECPGFECSSNSTNVWKVGQASWEQLNYTMLSVAGKGIFVAKSTFLVVLLPAYMLMKIFQWLISIAN